MSELVQLARRQVILHLSSPSPQRQTTGTIPVPGPELGPELGPLGRRQLLYCSLDLFKGAYRTKGAGL
jgi:hypothetical protein